jgi:protein-S-isoprenylcysteine O-methyltransferase Ste14
MIDRPAGHAAGHAEHGSSSFGVAAHFASGLVHGAHGDGKSSESLSLSPPQVVVASSLLSLAVHFFLLPLPLTSLPLPHRLAAAMVCFVGFIMGVKQVVGVLTEVGSSPHHTEATTALVTTGPYALSRNPAYIIIQLIPTGFALAANSFWPLLLAIPLIIAYLQLVVIPKEEELLERQFPDEWRSYSARVRRWI